MNVNDILAYRRYLTGHDENIKAYHFIQTAANISQAKELKDDANLVFKQVAHCFDSGLYKKYYNENISENPMPLDTIFNDFNFPERLRWVKRKLREQKAETVLDLGCSEGSYALNIAKEGYNVTGVNLFTNSIKIANERAVQLELADRARFIQSDIMEFESEKKFDAVLLFEVIEHVPDPKALVEKMVSLIEPDGVCYISTPNGTADFKASMFGVDQEDAAHFQFKGHVRVFTEESIRELLKDYEVLEVMIKQEGIFSLMHVAFRRKH